ncbi:MAG: endolytic transglycosylase MltG [Proteobacteria bacterium]|nr:endolytic transglycosylase MltG [Pseudomonadota bacterium]MBU4278349.1 endolytic transglycosylase MltG [Pseudomonadota bacterium]MBU4381985.1 endolytic transglycosylase MltG [Pseudomonadota bacterium]MBU4606396.1 endolytic transglycosylase MltG [Pseudomonadota bacterium]MCG2762861.1 endolytic transglycosylase MltG [Desulfarculaceae bacterium]
MKPWRHSLLALLAALALLAGVAAGGYWGGKAWLLERRASQSGQTELVEIAKGSSLAQAAKALADAGIVGNARLFQLAGRLTSEDGPILAGEYELSPAMNAARILHFLRSGRVKLHYLLIPEGYTLAQIAARLDESGIAEQAEVLRLATDQDFAAGLGVDQPSLEGYLFPDTYRFPRHLGARAAMSAMVGRYHQAWQALAQAAKQQGWSRHKATTLASIIQREAGKDQEMPLISAVYRNRLKRGMRLQADPTVIYGLGGAYKGNLTRAHLESDTTYNTYTRTGLPPGPICSPGREALAAALRPAQVPYLYFVAKGDGSHQFSTTYAQHQKAVDAFQRHH